MIEVTFGLRPTSGKDSTELSIGRLNWFQLNNEKGEVGIYAETKDFKCPLQFSPTKRRCHTMLRNRASETLNLAVVPTIEDTRDDTNESPTHKKTTKKDRQWRRSTREEDAIGVDEESIYSDSESLQALCDSNF
jgi:negative regulator of sigma E activity